MKTNSNKLLRENRLIYMLILHVEGLILISEEFVTLEKSSICDSVKRPCQQDTRVQRYIGETRTRKIFKQSWRSHKKLIKVFC